jgi:hypothetical protein
MVTPQEVDITFSRRLVTQKKVTLWASSPALRKKCPDEDEVGEEFKCIRYLYWQRLNRNVMDILAIGDREGVL